MLTGCRYGNALLIGSIYFPSGYFSRLQVRRVQVDSIFVYNRVATFLPGIVLLSIN